MIDRPLESFVFYRSFRDAIEEMTDENKLATLLAICDYALYGVEPDLKDAMSRAVFTVARPSIDTNKDRRANGKLCGRPPKKPKVSESGAKETDEPPHLRFVPPDVPEVEAYCSERKNGIDPAAFIDYYAARGWKLNGGQTMKDWKAAVRTWERRNKAEQRGGSEDDYWK